MEIRKLSKSFVNEAYNLGKDSFSSFPWFSKKFLRNTLGSEGCHLGAFKNGKLIGCLLAINDEMPKIWIYYMVVKKEFRGAGIGSLLMKRLFNLRQKKRHIIFVDTSKSNNKAVKFYKKHGFVIAAKVRHWYGKDIDGILLRKMFSKK